MSENNVTIVKPLEWSEEKVSNKDVKYNHVIAETPFGRFVIAWKSNDSFDVMESPLEPENYKFFSTLEQAKESCQEDFNVAILKTLL